jgi:mono/diheme cytochrome c family protein
MAELILKAESIALAIIVCMVFDSAYGASPEQIQRGEYLARAGDCVSCHTARGGAPYAGGFRMETPFGYLLSPNITPDIDTGIGRWSADDLYRALHDGVNRRGQDMYPVMPYTFYTNVTREDSDAIYAYLRTVTPVRNTVDINQLHFPFDQRWSMVAWRELYFTEGTFKPDVSRTPAWNRGAYLVEGLGHCSACHSPRNRLGAIETKREFTGATIDGWFALNLSSNLHTGLGEWTAEQIATYLKTGALAGKTTALGPMVEVVKNSLSYLTDADLTAMAEYLKSIPANSSLRASDPTAGGSRRRGAALYLEHCSGCHQAKGRGVPGVFPPLAGNGVVMAPDPANILKVVLGGVRARNGYVGMPSFAGQLDDEQLAELANYLRVSWGNRAPANTNPDMAASLRRSLQR